MKSSNHFFRIALVFMFAIPLSLAGAGEKPEAPEATGTAPIKKTNATAPAETKTESLIENYDFENGTDGQPANWSTDTAIDHFPLDNLTTFWVKRPGGVGKCLKIDTDVYKAEWKKRRDELKENPEAPAWNKTITKGKKYNTIGGIDGIHVCSDHIPLKEGAVYRVTVEVMSMAPKVEVFLKGYIELRGRLRQVYKKRIQCLPDKKDPGKWKTYTGLCHPSETLGQMPTSLRVILYANWPAGEVYIDNVLLTEEKPTASPENEKDKDEK